MPQQSPQPIGTFPDLRVGQGFDVHRWSEDPSRPFVLGGVTVAGVPGLVGHSDADVAAHACTDAILSAAALGDIGMMFPDTSADFRDADSIEMLRLARQRLSVDGWQVINIDCTVILDRPKLHSYRDQMAAKLSGAANAPVTIKGKRTEDVEALQQAVQCHAVALIGRVGKE